MVRGVEFRGRTQRLNQADPVDRGSRSDTSPIGLALYGSHQGYVIWCRTSTGARYRCSRRTFEPADVILRPDVVWIRIQEGFDGPCILAKGKCNRGDMAFDLWGCPTLPIRQDSSPHGDRTTRRTSTEVLSRAITIAAAVRSCRLASATGHGFAPGLTFNLKAPSQKLRTIANRPSDTKNRPVSRRVRAPRRSDRRLADSPDQ